MKFEANEWCFGAGEAYQCGAKRNVENKGRQNAMAVQRNLFENVRGKFSFVLFMDDASSARSSIEVLGGFDCPFSKKLYRGLMMKMIAFSALAALSRSLESGASSARSFIEVLDDGASSALGYIEVLEVFYFVAFSALQATSRSLSESLCRRSAAERKKSVFLCRCTCCENFSPDKFTSYHF